MEQIHNAMGFKAFGKMHYHHLCLEDNDLFYGQGNYKVLQEIRLNAPVRYREGKESLKVNDEIREHANAAEKKLPIAANYESWRRATLQIPFWRCPAYHFVTMNTAGDQQWTMTPPIHYSSGGRRGHRRDIKRRSGYTNISFMLGRRRRWWGRQGQ